MHQVPVLGGRRRQNSVPATTVTRDQYCIELSAQRCSYAYTTLGAMSYYVFIMATLLVLTCFLQCLRDSSRRVPFNLCAHRLSESHEFPDSPSFAAVSIASTYILALLVAVRFDVSMYL